MQLKSLDKYIKDKVQGYKAPYQEDLWKNIEKKLPPPRVPNGRGSWMFPVVPVVELGTGPLTFELLPTFCPFQPVVLTFCAVLPVSQPSTIPQDRSSKRTDARNILSPLGSNFIWRFNRKETQKGLTEQVLSLQGHYSEREAEGKAAFKPLFPRIAD